MPKPKRKSITLWGGYESNRLGMLEVDTGWGGFGTGDRARMPAIFRTRREARERYQDVRRVEIRALAKENENAE